MKFHINFEFLVDFGFLILNIYKHFFKIVCQLVVVGDLKTWIFLKNCEKSIENLFAFLPFFSFL